MFRILTFTLFVTAVAPLSASLLTISGYASAASGITTTDRSTTTELSLFDAQSQPGAPPQANRGSQFSYTMLATYGGLSWTDSYSAVCSASTCGGEFTEGNFTLFASDLMTFSGAVTGYLGLDFLATSDVSASVPSIVPSSGASYFWLGVSNTNTSLGADAYYSSGEGFRNTTPYTAYSTKVTTNSVTRDAENPDIYHHVFAGRAYIPFTGSALNLGMRGSDYWGCNGNTNGPCSASVSSNFIVGGAAVYDTNFALIQNAVISAGSGHDYTAALPVSATPEPATSVLCALCTIAVGFLGRRRTIRQRSVQR